MRRPWLFVDVDGVVAPILRAGVPAGERLMSWPGAPYEISVDRRLPGWARRLDAAFEVRWCTTWEGDAPAAVGAPLRLPSWPYLPLTAAAAGRGPLKHKTAAVRSVLTAAPGPFAWVDDDLGRVAPVEVRRLRLPHLAVRTRPDVGLTDRIVARLLSFAAGCARHDGGDLSDTPRYDGCGCGTDEADPAHHEVGCGYRRARTGPLAGFDELQARAAKDRRR